MADIKSLFVEVDGINTHYLEAGNKDAPTVALLHSGEFGGCAEISWEFLAEVGPACVWLALSNDSCQYGYADLVRLRCDFGVRWSTPFGHACLALHYASLRACVSCQIGVR